MPTSQNLTAIYCRVSTAGQEEGTSLQSQERAAREYCVTIGASEPVVYQDTHTGSELFERPGLSALREALSRKEYRAVVVYALDRLARKVVHQLIIAEEIARAGAELHIVSEPLDQSPEGQLISYVRGYASELEREKIRERTLRGKHERARQGRISAKPPYGYRQHDGTRTIDEFEASVVRQMYDWCADGISVREITRRLDTPSPTGKQWGRSHVHRVLTNPTYRGETILFRWKRDGKRIVLRDGDTISVPTPAIVSPDLWQRAQIALEANAGAHTRNEREPYLLRGMIWCRQCGRRMYCEPSKGARYYRCSQRCGAKMIPADGIEAEVWTAMRTTLEEPIRALRAPTSDAASRLAVLEKRLASVDAGIGRMLATLRNVPGLETDIERQVTKAAEEKSALRRQIDALRETETREAQSQAAFGKAKGMIMELRSRVGDADFATRRSILETMRVSVYAQGDDADMECVLPEANVAVSMRSA